MEKRLRIYHGPVNIGGTGGYLSAWQRRKGAISDFIVWWDSSSRKNNDFDLNLPSYERARTRLLIIFFHFLLCLVKYDLFHFYFGVSFLPRNLDLPILKLFKKKIIMTYCGSDIRLVEVERRRNPYSYLLRINIDDPKYDKGKRSMMRWQNRWVDQFTAVRNLYAYAVEVLPRNKVRNDFWINNVHLDFSIEAPDYAPKTPPVLVHAPSEAGIKGSRYVEEAIGALREEGYEFKYIRLEKVPNREAHRIYQEEADIIIDQFLVGGLGNFACEGMFYGKPVCCYLIDEFFEWYPDCPVVNCTIENLKEKLAWLIENPEVRKEIGRSGRAFVKKHCDPEEINQKVWEMYLEVMERK